MFIGHVATALAAKKLEPRASLGMYVLAATAPDILFSALLLAGWERVEIAPGHTAVTPLAFVRYPYSHSLVGGLILGTLIGALYWVWCRRSRAAVVLAGLVLGHWLLDVLSHVPDMPVGPAGPFLGLGLWRSITATFAVEGGLFALGVWLYLRATRAKDRVGRWALGAYVALLVAMYVSGPFGGPPPSAMALGIGNSVGCALLVLWAWWIDRHREARA